MKVQPIYTNKIIKKVFEFAGTNSTLFAATTSLVLSTVARPIAIMSTPKTDMENKKYACAKSLSSSIIGYLLMLGVSTPFAKAIKNIDNNPSKFLKEKTINILKSSEKTLIKSKKYTFATQILNLGLGFLIAVPKSALTCALIPPVMSKIFPQKDKKPLSFTGHTEKLSKWLGKIIDTKTIQKLAEKYHNTKYEQHIICATDILSTGAFIHQTSKNKKIENSRKKALMYNAGISTLLCITGGYAISRVLNKPTEKFIEKFKHINKNSPKLEKYIEGIRVAKPTLILGAIYYMIIPFISTFLADRFDKKSV